MKKSILALVLALCMCLGLGIPAFAGGEPFTGGNTAAEVSADAGDDGIVEEGSGSGGGYLPEEAPAAEADPAVPVTDGADVAASGSFGYNGSNLTWSLTENGTDGDGSETYTLTISGEGEMPGYRYSNPGWYSWRYYITSVVIESGVTNIGGFAFYQLENLTAVSIPDTVTAIGDGAFSGCASLPGIVIPDSVTNIGMQAFYSCTSLRSVNIPDSVTAIEESTFSHCESLQSVEIPDSVTSIGSSAFYECVSLKTIVIPDSVTSIESRAFQYCSSLESVTIGTGVTSIESSAFWYCPSLSIRYAGTVEQWVDLLRNNGMTNTVSGSGTFTDCNGYTCDDCGPCGDSLWWGLTETGASGGSATAYLLTISGEGDMDDFKLNRDGEYEVPWGDYNEQITAIVIEDGVTSIGNNAFRNCAGLTEITIAGTVTGIGSDAFLGCTGLVSVTIPSGVTSIGYEAFRGCTGLESVVIPASVTEIDSSAFFLCDSLAGIYFGGTIVQWAGIFGNSTGEVVNTDTGNVVWNTPVTDRGGTAYSIYGTCGDSLGWAFLDGTLTVGGEGEMSFSIAPWRDYAGEITSVDIGDAVTGIADGAFSGCRYLEDINMGSGVTTIGNSAFSNCAWLESVVIGSGVTTIGDYAFYACDDLDSVIIPGTVTYIGYKAFGYDDYDTSVSKGNEIRNDDLTIYGYTGTAAQEYAVDNGFTFVALDGLDISDVTNGSGSSGSRASGDINGDGSVNISDVQTLLKYVNGQSVSVNAAALDVNGDGVVNISDVQTLLKYVNGQNVTIC